MYFLVSANGEKVLKYMLLLHPPYSISFTQNMAIKDPPSLFLLCLSVKVKASEVTTKLNRHPWTSFSLSVVVTVAKTRVYSCLCERSSLCVNLVAFTHTVIWRDRTETLVWLPKHDTTCKNPFNEARMLTLSLHYSGIYISIVIFYKLKYSKVILITF